MKKNLEQALDNFKEKNILVIGDIILDQFSWGKIERVNPEQPAAHLVKIVSETYNLGGAANVANNIKSLGAKCCLYGVIGKDYSGEKMLNLCLSKEIDFRHYYGENETLVKQRIMAHRQQVARADYGEKNLKKINKEIQDVIICDLEKELIKYDFVILSDYNKQIFSERFSKKIISLSNKFGVPTLVDPKPSNIDYFQNCIFVSPNKKEASEITNIKYSKNSLKDIGKTLCEKINSKYSIITCGEGGAFIYSKEGKCEMIETKAKEVSNPTGAGDTFAATFALSIASGLDVFESAQIANYAAGIVVEKPGTATATLKEIKNIAKIR